MAFKMCGRALAFSIGAIVGLAPAVYAQESDVAAEKKPATFDDFLARLPDQPAPSLDDAAASVEEPAEEDSTPEGAPDEMHDADVEADGSAVSTPTADDETSDDDHFAPDLENEPARKGGPYDVTDPEPEEAKPEPPVNRVLVAGAAGLAAAAGVLPTLVLSLLIPVPFLSTIAAVVVVNLLTRDFEASRAVAISGLVGFALGAVLAVVAGAVVVASVGNAQLEVPADLVPVYGFLSKGFVAALAAGLLGGSLMTVPFAATAALIFSPSDAELPSPSDAE